MLAKPCFHLATRPLLTQHNRTALIEANDVERVLADIDADYGNCSVECLRHGVLLVFGAPCQLQSLAGQEHGRTIPLADVSRDGNTALKTSASSFYQLFDFCDLCLRTTCAIRQCEARGIAAA